MPLGIAAVGSHLYWTNNAQNTAGAGSVWEASLDGSSAHAIVTGQNAPIGVAADGSHLYWANVLDQAIELALSVAAEVERIPQEFVEAYREEFASWGQRFGKSFGATTIILREVPGAPVELDGWGNRPLLAVEVVAEILERGADFVKLLIKPADEQSEMRIRKHAEDIVRYGEPVARRAH
jgi:hypothetical protein